MVDDEIDAESYILAGGHLPTGHYVAGQGCDYI